MRLPKDEEIWHTIRTTTILLQRLQNGVSSGTTARTETTSIAEEVCVGASDD